MTCREALLLLFVLVVTACATVNPTIAQLERAKALAANGNYAAIHGLEVACQPSQPGCGQLRWIKADACRRLAAAGDPAAFDCAVADYRAAIVALETRPDPMVEPATLRLALLETLHERRERSVGAEVARTNDLLLAEARAARSDAGAATAGHYYAANAELNAALRTPAPGGCDGIARAMAELAAVDARGTAFEARAEALHRAAASVRARRRCGS